MKTVAHINRMVSFLAHRSLAKITFGHAYRPATMESSMAEADLSCKDLEASGAIVLAAWEVRIVAKVSL